jgi:Flp pilus assembly protein TadD
VLRQMGDTEGAAVEAKLGAQITKEKNSLQAATFNTNSGQRMLNAGDVDGAIGQFRAAINLSPEYAPAHFHLAEALKRKGEQAEAEKELEKAAELDSKIKSR